MRITGIMMLAMLLAGCAGTALRTNELLLQDEAGSVTHLSLLLGERELNDNTAGNLDVDDQTIYGVEVDSYDGGSGNGFEVGLATSSEDNTVGGVEVEAELTEIYAGFRKTFMPDEKFHPFVSGGLSYIKGELDVGPSDDDTDLATYLRLGVLWDVGERIRLGIDYRRLFGGFSNIFGGHADADYDQVVLSLGYRF